jgi:hypothetical protein
MSTPEASAPAAAQAIALILGVALGGVALQTSGALSIACLVADALIWMTFAVLLLRADHHGA